MNDSASTVTHDDQPPETGRALTWRSLGIGALLVVALGLITPWNDWFLQNTSLYLHYLPPAVVLVILVLSLILNPLLGRHRLRTGEMAVITIMLLALGGVVSSGLMRYLPFMTTAPAGRLRTGTSHETLRVDLSKAEIAALRTAFEADVDRLFAELDVNGDGRIDATEAQARADLVELVAARDGQALERQDLREILARDDPRATATTRWGLPHRLFLGVPAYGDIPRDDPEYGHVVEGFLRGLDERPYVHHRNTVTWQEDGQRFTRLALAGDAAHRARERGQDFLDLDSSAIGRALSGLRVGDETSVDGRRLVVEAITQASIPWYAWVEPLLAWAPLLLGAFVASLAIAGAVRRQWIENERLQFPIGEVTMSLLAAPTGRQRYNELFRNPAFWTACVVVLLLLLWHGFGRWGYLPVNLTLHFDFFTAPDAPFRGDPWARAYRPHLLFAPRISFSIIAFAFFLSMDLSLSLWLSFILINVLFIGSHQAGMTMQARDVQVAAVGGYAAMCVLILYLGRQYYWRLLRCAFTWRGDDQTRACAPYVWGLLGGIVLMLIALMSYGAGFWASLLLILLFLGFMLVVSRIVAETGIPFIQVPNDWTINSVLFSCVGFGASPAALMPLAVIGISLMADTRESVMPYAVNAHYLARQSGLPSRRLTPLMLTILCLGVLIAGASMLRNAYRGDGPKDSGWPGYLLDSQAINLVSGGLHDQERAERLVEVHERRQRSQRRTWTTYGIGAGLVFALGALRIAFSWWPLHPLGFLCATAYPAWIMWFSIMVGWMWKSGVMRYGGTAVYQRLKPFAIGMIAGEMLAIIVFLIIKIIHPTLPAMNLVG